MYSVAVLQILKRLRYDNVEPESCNITHRIAFNTVFFNISLLAGVKITHPDQNNILMFQLRTLMMNINELLTAFSEQHPELHAVNISARRCLTLIDICLLLDPQYSEMITIALHT